MRLAPKILVGSVVSLVALSQLFAGSSESPSSDERGTLFTKLDPSALGLDVVNAYSDPAMWADKYSEFQGGAVGTGLAAGDIDGDGWVDLYVVTKTGPNKLYRQTAPFQFIDITEAAGVAGGESWSTGSTFADIDNDGDLDLYVCYFDAPNQFFINDGKGRFTESAASFGIDVTSGSVVGAFSDYDRDGDLDLFLLTNVLDATANPDGEPDYLFRNNGDGSFTEVTQAAGISAERGKGHSATWWDADGDNWPDLYISNDFEAPDYLYKNNGDGTFTDVTDISLPHTAWYSMGSDFGDINNDGQLDFLATDMANTTHFKSKVTMGDMGGWVDFFDAQVTPQYMKNAVFLNSGTRRFQEVAKMTGLSSTDWTWSPRFEDFDNDGWLDLHVTNGMVRSFTDSDMVNKTKTLSSKRQIIALVKNSPVLREQNLAFRNDGADTLHFSKVTQQWGLEHEGVSFGSVAADFDNDGDFDLVYSNYDEKLSIYRNNGGNNFLTIALKGTRSNSYGIGARVELHSSHGTQVRKLTVARGVLSSSQPIAHFGLGSDTLVPTITVHWPSGTVQTLENVSVNQQLSIQEPDTGPAPSLAKQLIAPSSGLFAESSATLGLDFTRREETFNDMTRQSLLPHRMNTLGGGIAVGDVDRDGDQDIYFSGAAGHHGVLYLNDGKGHYSSDPRSQPWLDKKQTEEMAPLFVDIDLDGDLDLYVSSGSVEVLEGDPSLENELYLNSGDGTFAEVDASAYAPVSTSSSVVAASDYDRDGDLDLFIGGRVVPGEYPRAPRSVLLRNDQGKLVDVTDEVAPGLADSGMVTAALWTKPTEKGHNGLLILAELDSPRFFENWKTHLVESKIDRGLANIKGWWNSLAAADVDNDGDLDYIAGNLGLNTKYKANAEHPFKIYFNDFEGTGVCNIVEAKYEGDNLLPVRGRSCSSRAMPSIAERFPTFHDFGAASLASVYAPEKLETSLLKEANELGTGIFVNEKGRFTFKRLPRVAQMAPVYGIAAADFNGDGNIDLALAQNFNGPQVETGRYNGGLSVLLLGDGTGNFRGTEASESGIFIEDEARGMAVVDLNADGWPDLLATRPGNSVHAYLNRGQKGNNSLSLALRTLNPSNPQAIGAKVLVTYSDESKRAFEVGTNSGYLSQGEAVVFLGYTDTLTPEMVEVTWPNGKKSRKLVEIGNAQIVIEQPTEFLANEAELDGQELPLHVGARFIPRPAPR